MHGIHTFYGIFFHIVVLKLETEIGETVNVSWTAPFFPLAGHYFVYHKNITIISISSSGVKYGGDTMSTKYSYLTRPFTSTNIMFEIGDITVDDAGYYNGETSAAAALSGSGVVLIVSGMFYLCLKMLLGLVKAV